MTGKKLPLMYYALSLVNAAFLFVAITVIIVLLLIIRLQHSLRRLYQFNQHTIARNRVFVITLGVNKCNVVTTGSGTDTSRSKSYAFPLHPIKGSFQVVHPKAKVIEWWFVDLQ